ncbi:hypothetical protein AVEN_52863-1, partial [Araneus ventricosus]
LQKKSESHFPPNPMHACESRFFFAYCFRRNGNKWRLEVAAVATSF